MTCWYLQLSGLSERVRRAWEGPGGTGHLTGAQYTIQDTCLYEKPEQTHIQHVRAHTPPPTPPTPLYVPSGYKTTADVSPATAAFLKFLQCWPEAPGRGLRSILVVDGLFRKGTRFSRNGPQDAQVPAFASYRCAQRLSQLQKPPQPLGSVSQSPSSLSAGQNLFLQFSRKPGAHKTKQRQPRTTCGHTAARAVHVPFPRAE